MYTEYATLTIIAGLVQAVSLTIVGSVLVAILLRQRNDFLYRLMLLIALCAMIQNAAYLLELRSMNAEEALVSIRMYYIGGAFSPTFFLALTIIYCGYQLHNKMFRYLFLFDSLVVFSVWTCEFNHLYYTSVSFMSDAALPHTVLGKGPLYLANAALTGIQLIACFIITIRSFKKLTDKKQIRNHILLLCSSFFPMAAYILGLLGVFDGYDPVPVGLTLGMIVIALAIFRHHAFELAEIAHENIIQTMDEAVLIVDYNWGFVEANTKAQSLFPKLLEYKKGSPMKQGELAYLFSENEDSELELDGRIYYIHQNEIVIDHAVSGYSVLLFDITEERKQLARVQRLREEADKANHAKSTFLAHVSHEIRTPINAVLGMDEMILRESHETETKKYALDIKNAARTLLSIINDLLDSSKIESGKMEIVSVEYHLDRLLNDVYNMIFVKAQDKWLDLNFVISPDLPSVLLGDDIRIRQILLNLLSNGVKYTQEGSVSLKVTGRQENGQAVLCFSVIDTGIGIKEEDIPHLYEAFERADVKRNHNIEGTGLGMNITVQLLEMMGTSLHAESTYGEGSTFSFELVQQVVDSAPIGDFLQYRQQLAGDPVYGVSFVAPDANILIVDDSKINRVIFKSLLKQTQINITEADSGQTCLNLIKEHAFDLIFMDDMMPVMDGRETLLKMQEAKENRCHDVPVIMLTANAVLGARETYLALGFADFLTKPIDPEKLEAMLGRMLPQHLIRWSVADLEPIEAETVTADSDTLPEIEGVDWDYAKLHISSPDMLRQTAVSFQEAIPQDLLMLEELSGFLNEEQCLTDYRIRVHTIKSTAAMLGISSLSALAGLSEKAAKEKELDRLKLLHPVIMEELTLYKERLAILKQSHEPKEKADLIQILPLADMLCSALADRDYDAADILMEKIAGYDYGGTLQEQVELLQSQVLNLEAEKGRQTAEAIITEIKRETT